MEGSWVVTRSRLGSRRVLAGLRVGGSSWLSSRAGCEEDYQAFVESPQSLQTMLQEDSGLIVFGSKHSDIVLSLGFI